jgi:heme-binding protein
LTLRRKRLALASAAAALVILQITAPAKTNPPVDSTKALSSMSAPTPVIDILRRSCFDCHSSETRWPWYASVAPMSWLVVSDVNEGRGQLNFSKWTG